MNEGEVEASEREDKVLCVQCIFIVANSTSISVLPTFQLASCTRVCQKC